MKRAVLCTWLCFLLLPRATSGSRGDAGSTIRLRDRALLLRKGAQSAAEAGLGDSPLSVSAFKTNGENEKVKSRNPRLRSPTEDENVVAARA